VLCILTHRLTAVNTHTHTHTHTHIFNIQPASLCVEPRCLLLLSQATRIQPMSTRTRQRLSVTHTVKALNAHLVSRMMGGRGEEGEKRKVYGRRLSFTVIITTGDTPPPTHGTQTPTRVTRVSLFFTCPGEPFFFGANCVPLIDADNVQQQPPVYLRGCGEARFFLCPTITTIITTTIITIIVVGGGG